MNLSIAIVGLPNVGKSTLFNALLKQQVALAANYPFATIEPNHGIAEVSDERLAVLAEVVGTSVIKPATVEFVDVAGLVRGASAGEGLGNQFLSHIRETAAICHVLRAFSDADIIREGAVDPLEDLVTIRTELLLSDLQTLSRQAAPKGAADSATKERWQVIERFRAAVEKEAVAEVIALVATPEGRLVARELGLLSAKPELFALNVDEDQLAKSDTLQTEWAGRLGVDPTQVVIISAKIESELSSLSSEDQEAFLADLGVSESGLERLARRAYQRLQLQSFLTAGEKEVRAWTIRQGTTAPEAAGAIHTDFVKHFIRANVASYADFVAHKGWKGVREAGKLRQEGREYVMQPQDIVEFLIGK
jgi:GTP-binding protein YchF